MSKFSICITGDTLAELYASAAAFAASSGNATPSTVNVAVSDSGGLTAAVAPLAAPPGMTAPAPVAAPATTDSEPAEQTSAAEFDSAGIPWDERIHAGTRGVNQDGTWKRRRNTSDVLYASVMAELSQRTAGQAPTAPPASPAPAAPGIMDNGPVVIPAAPAPVAPPPTMVAPANVPAVPTPPVAAAPATPPAAPAPVVPVAEPPAAPAPVVPVAEPPAAPAPVVPVAEPVAPTEPAAPAAVGMSFGVLMPKIAQAMKEGRFDQNGLKGLLAQWNLQEIGQLAANPVMVQQFHDWLRAAQPPLID